MPMDFATQVPLYLVDVEPTSAVDHIEYTAEADKTGCDRALQSRRVGHDHARVAGRRPRSSDRRQRATDGLRGHRRSITVAAGIADRERGVPGDRDERDEPDRQYRNGARQDELDDRLHQCLHHEPDRVDGARRDDRLQHEGRLVYRVREPRDGDRARAQRSDRHVANILVDDAQDMHSINEFYLGDALGWRRVEPQGTSQTIPEDYGVIMRLVLPADEGDGALAERNGIVGGAPLHEFTEPVDGGDRITPDYVTHWNFEGCTNRADPQAFLRDDAADVRPVRPRAHAVGTDVAAYATGGPAPRPSQRAARSSRTHARRCHGDARRLP